MLFDALPLRRNDLKNGNKTLVFDDGRGLTISSNGSYWVETTADVRAAVFDRKRDLDEIHREIADVIVLSGVI